MSKDLLAKPLVEASTNKLIDEVSKLKNNGVTPTMKVILVGNNPASEVYVRHKKNLCEKIGADFQLIRLEENVSEMQFLDVVKKENQNPQTHGLFIQLPIPKHLEHIDTTVLVNPEKDVDGFHFQNIAPIYAGTKDLDLLIPCTPKGIIKLLKFYDIELESKNCVIIGRSLIVGKPLALLLTNQNATVTLCHSRTKDLERITKEADIIISAVGKTKWLDRSYINKNKNQVVIDVGINRDDNGKLCGDVHYSELKDLVACITPVPGGVGPLTVLSLMENLIIATKKLKKI